MELAGSHSAAEHWDPAQAIFRSHLAAVVEGYACQSQAPDVCSQGSAGIGVYMLKDVADVGM